MKKTFAITIALLFVTLTLYACASPEKRLENIIKQQTGQDVEIKDGGGSITVKGEGGESATVSVGDDLKWPTGKLGNLPELKGKVIGVYEVNGGYSLTLEGVSKADAEAYLQKLKELGYSDGMEMKQDDSVIFSGSTDGAEVMFQYSLENDKKSVSTVSLTYAPKK